MDRPASLSARVHMTESRAYHGRARLCVCACVRHTYTRTRMHAHTCAHMRVRACADGWLGTRRPLKNSGSHIDASLSRQPLVKGERLVRLEVNAVIMSHPCSGTMCWRPKSWRYLRGHAKQRHAPYWHHVECVWRLFVLRGGPVVGSSSQADRLLRNSAMDDSIGGS